MAGSARHSLRKEKRSIYRGLRELQREVGDTVLYYEPAPAASSVDPIYDEGPGPGAGLVFRAGVGLPAVWIRYQAPSSVQTESGEYTMSMLSLRISGDEMRRAGLYNPMSPDQHYNDRFSYNGFLYRVEEYEPKGWLQGEYLMVDIMGRELKPDELVTDSFPFWQLDSTPLTPGQTLPWPNTPPYDLEDDPGPDPVP